MYWIFYGLFCVLLISIQYYLTLRLWPVVRWLGCPRWLLGTMMTLAGLSYPLSRVSEPFLSSSANGVLTVLGSYWLGIMFYGFWVFFFSDMLWGIARLRYKKSAWPAQKRAQSEWLRSIACLLIVIAVCSYGIWNARNPVITTYEVTIGKSAGTREQLNIVLVSDIHAGRVIGNGQLDTLVRKINELDPDLILLPGDMIDENVNVFAEERMAEQFSALHSRLGIYASLGNHEYISRDPQSAAAYLRQGGINVLIDQWVKIEDSIYIVGRDDLAAGRFTGKNRLPLAKVLENADASLPIIVLDHQPFHLEEADQARVDLQVSGHTHQGQLFPLQFITKLLYETDWGYLKKNYLQVIVSSGYGFWGPPLRVGNHPEIVLIHLKFAPAEHK